MKNYILQNFLNILPENLFFIVYSNLCQCLIFSDHFTCFLLIFLIFDNFSSLFYLIIYFVWKVIFWPVLPWVSASFPLTLAEFLLIYPPPFQRQMFFFQNLIRIWKGFVRVFGFKYSIKVIDLRHLTIFFFVCVFFCPF